MTLDDAYADALVAWLEEGGEIGLERAYELGRRAMREGRGILDLLAIHEASVARVRSAERRNRHATRRAAAFLREGLSAFDMAQRGHEASLEALERAHRELLVQAGELETFSYTVAHDLRAPLRAILGFSGVLAEDYVAGLDARGADYLERVCRAARRMDQLIDALLGLARVTRAELVMERVDLSALAREVVENDPRARAHVEIQPGLIATADGRLMRVVLENLLANAWKFSEGTAAARISVTGAREGERLWVHVRDNGAGFDPQGAHLLFRPFQRLHKATEFEGTGVGLATVHRIVVRHGGEVRAEGEVGAGAVFSFGVPAG